MPTLTARVCALTLTLAVAAATLTTAPAQAAPTIPTGYAYADLNAGMKAALKAAPCKGGRIDVVLYSANRDDLIDTLVDRARCGVKVRLVTAYPKPDGEHEDDLSDGVSELTSRLRKAGATVKVCHGACARSGSAGIEHEKLVLVDTGSRKYVLSDSGNWTHATDLAYNDRLTVADAKFYRGVLAHVDRLAKDRSIKHEAPVRSSDGEHVMYFMPASQTDPVAAWARKAKCGKGDRVVFANFYFTSSKKTLAGDLIRFRKAGADVRVAANDRKWSTSLRRKLVKAGVRVYDTDQWLKAGHRYNHRKMLAATGCSGGAFGAQGSTTMNSTAYTKNSNEVTITRVPSEVGAMLNGFNRMTAGKAVDR